MAEDSLTKTMASPPEAVWAAVGDFGGLETFFPGIESFRVDGDDRYIGMFGLVIKEHLVGRDEAARTITYSLVDGVPLEHHEATIAVRPHAAGCEVTWSFDIEPESMLPIFADTYQKALEALSAHFSS